MCSRARWNALANPVPISPIKLVNAFAAPDDWAGYTRARAALLDTIRARSERDVVFLTGDIHTFVTTGVPTSMDDPTPLAGEFVSGSITSFGFGEVTIGVGGGVTLQGDPDNPGIPQGLLDALLGLNPWAVDVDVSHHGYGVARFAADAVNVEYVRMDTVRQRSGRPIAPLRYVLPRGEVRPQIV